MLARSTVKPPGSLPFEKCDFKFGSSGRPSASIPFEPTYIFACRCDLIHISILQALLLVVGQQPQMPGLMYVGMFMDDTFYRDRARHIRELAKEADPVIKKRLLRLASNYDAMTTPYARGTIDSFADSLAESRRDHGK
jgi:hypothetical protein